MQKTRSPHRSQGKRLKQREQHGDGQCYSELQEIPADNPLHESHGKEDRNDGGGGSYGCKGYLIRAF